MLKELFNSIGITPAQIRIFLFSFTAVSVMVILQQLGIHSPIRIF